MYDALDISFTHNYVAVATSGVYQLWEKATVAVVGTLLVT
jgi:hypothetical protein